VGSDNDSVEVIAEAVPRLEALRARDILAEAGVTSVLEPDGGLDMGRPTNVLVASSRASFARRVLEDAHAGADWVANDSPAGLLVRIEEHLDALRGLVDELAQRLEQDAAASPGRVDPDRDDSS
jgi:hypothetical protein